MRSSFLEQFTFLELVEQRIYDYEPDGGHAQENQQRSSQIQSERVTQRGRKTSTERSQDISEFQRDERVFLSLASEQKCPSQWKSAFSLLTDQNSTWRRRSRSPRLERNRQQPVLYNVHTWNCVVIANIHYWFSN